MSLIVSGLLFFMVYKISKEFILGWKFQLRTILIVMVVSSILIISDQFFGIRLPQSKIRTTMHKKNAQTCLDSKVRARLQRLICPADNQTRQHATFIFLAVLTIQQSFSQNQLRGIILDQETKVPIEYVDIYNKEDYTSSNEEGKFLFVSNNDSLKVSILGYNTISSTFQEQKSDTIFLTKKIQNLDEIVINYDSNLFKSVLSNLEENYPLEPYQERFFLRSVLKRNGEIVQLADFNGKVERKTLFSTKSNPMPRKNYSIEIENLRKAGIKKEDIEFTLSSFEQLFQSFISIYMNPEIYNFKYIPYKDSSFAKLEFNPKRGSSYHSSGYYIINLNDKAFNEVRIVNSPNVLYTNKRSLKYRTTNYEMNITFRKDPGVGKYVIDKANMTATVEVLPKKSERILYEVSYKLYTYDSFESMDVKHNISPSKDIFRLKGDYNDDFWKSQHYLLLTQEMKRFLETLSDENNDFKSVTNIKS